MSKEKILRMLIDNKQPITSKTFARNLGVSSRSVINYIKEINQEQNRNVIKSGHLGYSASIDEVLEILRDLQQASEVPQNFSERSTFIVKELLFNNSVFNVYDLAAELFVSVSTLKNDIYKTNKLYEKFNCQIKYENDDVYISGSGRNKRLLSAFIIRKETVGSLMDLNILKNVFNKDLVKASKTSLDLLISSNNLKIDDYAYMNLLLHLLILIDKASDIGFYGNKPDYTKFSNLTKELCGLISNKINVIASEDQLKQVDDMLAIHFPSIKGDIYQNNKAKVSEKALITSKKICTNIDQIFSFDICSQDFIISFSQHLDNLILRIKQDHHEKNPMTQVLKRDNPIVFEVAVYVALQIIEIYNLDKDSLTEDEIAFIALHVGSAISKSINMRNKLTATIISPKYHDIRDNLVRNIYSSFHNELIINRVVSFPHEVLDINYDLLIKTVPDDIFMTDNSVLIDLLDYDKNKLLIQDKITNIKNINNTRLLINEFDDIFIEDLFFKAEDNHKYKYDVIKFLGEKMTDLDLIDADYLDNILKREAISSTAFGNIALPHSLKMDAKKTNISVLISNKGIVWDDSLVNIVMLIAISPDDIKNFESIYEGLLALFKDENIPYVAKQFSEYKDIKKFFKETNKFVT